MLEKANIEIKYSVLSILHKSPTASILTRELSWRLIHKIDLYTGIYGSHKKVAKAL